jgi:hypothetical protein
MEPFIHPEDDQLALGACRVLLCQNVHTLRAKIRQVVSASGAVLLDPGRGGQEVAPVPSNQWLPLPSLLIEC